MYDDAEVRDEIADCGRIDVFDIDGAVDDDVDVVEVLEFVDDVAETSDFVLVDDKREER